MKATDFAFDLPESLIALRPSEPRDACRLLVLHRDGSMEHRIFRDLPEYLGEGDLLLLNNTRVFPARLTATKKTGGKLALLLVREVEPCVWEVLSRERYTGSISLTKELSGDICGGKLLRIREDAGERHDFRASLRKAGSMPLPPYIKRKPEERDRQWYQTVYARAEGSIAAPTAGLHFTEKLLSALEAKGVRIRFLTLHVGTGTFKPIRAAHLENHAMDEEYFEFDRTVLETIREVKESGKRILSVGTTTTRAIEGFLSGHFRKIEAENRGNGECGIAARREKIRGSTNIFIYPGYSFTSVDSLITNFHLPQSTPLMLASAFAGVEKLLDAYKRAVSMEYRFFSYGDAMLIL
ncbi:MAG: tRNA preQ1(34) S-adenosylmethionine ribosyltransferase-isomerase QueA [Nitrospirae bacterium]|nr:tRNA preQ1(34) S-adenosylmethionine ribosyltransferase-isomerase QueA [Nitrospirota bacterium]